MFALLTGSSSGIGYSIASRLLEDGYDAVISGRNHDRLLLAAAQLRSTFKSSIIHQFLCDFVDSTSIQALHAILTDLKISINALICNVGSGRRLLHNLEEPTVLLNSFHCNFMSAYSAVYHLHNLMTSNSSIVFISSIVASQLLPAPIGYTISKSALNALAKKLSKEFSPDIRVNVISPGNVMFPGSTWDQKIKANPKAVSEYIEDNVPLKHFATPSEIADTVSFLISSRSSFITGANITIDGGQSLVI